MKANILPSDFSPVTIKLTFETQAELDALASLLNYPAIVYALEQAGFSSSGCEDVREVLKQAGGSTVSKIAAFRHLTQ